MNTGRGLEQSGQDFGSNQGPGSFERSRSGGCRFFKVFVAITSYLTYILSVADSNKMDKFNDYGANFIGGGSGSGPTGISTVRDDDNECGFNTFFSIFT